MERAWKAGIVVVGAAGNERRNNSAGNQGYGTINSPANDPFVITVGALRDMATATRADDVIASYSSKGPTLFDRIVKPDIVAPGNKIVSNQGKGGHILAQNYPENKSCRYILSAEWYQPFDTAGQRCCSSAASEDAGINSRSGKSSFDEDGNKVFSFDQHSGG